MFFRTPMSTIHELQSLIKPLTFQKQLYHFYMNFTHYLPYTPQFYHSNPYSQNSFQLQFLTHLQPMTYTFYKPTQNLYQPTVSESYDFNQAKQSKFSGESEKNASKYHSEGQLYDQSEISRPSSKMIFKYGKKNVESNVINQIFSYLSTRSKSRNSLYLLFEGSEQLICLYYEVMKQIKRKNKKYINRFYLKNLIEMEQNHIGCAILRRVDREDRIKLQRLRRILRILTSYYLREICGNAILTSSKLDKQTKKEHLERRREIKDYLNYHIKFGMKDHSAV